MALENTRILAEKIDNKELACYLRKFMHASLLMSYEYEDSDTYKKELGDGYYWLTALVEKIDPVMDRN